MESRALIWIHWWDLCGDCYRWNIFDFRRTIVNILHIIMLTLFRILRDVCEICGSIKPQQIHQPQKRFHSKVNLLSQWCQRVDFLWLFTFWFWFKIRIASHFRIFLQSREVYSFYFGCVIMWNLLGLACAIVLIEMIFKF